MNETVTITEKPAKILRNKRLPETRVTEDELLAIKDKAAQSGLTVSEYQRQALLNCVVVERKNVIELKLIKALLAIGNNLNQLVKKTHIHDETDTQHMRAILAKIDHLVTGLISDR